MNDCVRARQASGVFSKVWDCALRDEHGPICALLWGVVAQELYDAYRNNANVLFGFSSFCVVQFRDGDRLNGAWLGPCIVLQGARYNVSTQLSVQFSPSVSGTIWAQYVPPDGSCCVIIFEEHGHRCVLFVSWLFSWWCAECYGF